eukprot:4418246-Pleurochrysis_carterae.AAC.2
MASTDIKYQMTIDWLQLMLGRARAICKLLIGQCYVLSVSLLRFLEHAEWLCIGMLRSFQIYWRAEHHTFGCAGSRVIFAWSLVVGVQTNAKPFCRAPPPRATAQARPSPRACARSPKIDRWY